MHRSIWLHAEHLEAKGDQISFPRSKGDLRAPSPSPPSRAGRGYGFMRVACISLCSGASLDIMNAALVHEDDLPSRRSALSRLPYEPVVSALS